MYTTIVPVSSSQLMEELHEQREREYLHLQLQVQVGQLEASPTYIHHHYAYECVCLCVCMYMYMCGGTLCVWQYTIHLLTSSCALSKRPHLISILYARVKGHGIRTGMES